MIAQLGNQENEIRGTLTRRGKVYYDVDLVLGRLRWEYSASFFGEQLVFGCRRQDARSISGESMSMKLSGSRRPFRDKPKDGSLVIPMRPD